VVDSDDHDFVVPEYPDVGAFVEILNRYGVRYVVIGGAAAQIQVRGLPPTKDVGITPARDPENLDRLSGALSEFGARIRSDAVPGGLKFSHSGTSLANALIWNLTTRLGDFDITFTPAAFAGGYEELAIRARPVAVQGVIAPVADLADIVRSKAAANRPKDQLLLPRLRQALRERDARRQAQQSAHRRPTQDRPGPRLDKGFPLT
jgi:hypothetical protein